MGRGFITPWSGDFPTGLELDHAALEAHVQAELPQSMTVVEYLDQRLALLQGRRSMCLLTIANSISFSSGMLTYIMLRVSRS